MEKKTKAPARLKATATTTTRRAAKSPVTAKTAAKSTTKAGPKPRTRAAKAAPPNDSAGFTTAVAPDRSQIAQAAYGLFEQSGHRHGHELEHWLEAESRLLRGLKL